MPLHKVPVLCIPIRIQIEISDNWLITVEFRTHVIKRWLFIWRIERHVRDNGGNWIFGRKHMTGWTTS